MCEYGEQVRVVSGHLEKELFCLFEQLRGLRPSREFFSSQGMSVDPSLANPFQFGFGCVFFPFFLFSLSHFSASGFGFLLSFEWVVILSPRW